MIDHLVTLNLGFWKVKGHWVKVAGLGSGCICMHFLSVHVVYCYTEILFGKHKVSCVACFFLDLSYSRSTSLGECQLQFCCWLAASYANSNFV